MSKIKKTIGIFDSGIGGLSVMKQVIKYLPDYDLIYFGDTARVPYGNKSKEIIKKYSIQNTKFLNKRNAEIIIIGCNTASAVAYHDVKKHTNSLVIDVVLPGVKRAIKVSKNKKIGIIATSATINSKAHENYIKKIDPKISVFNKACPILALLAENNGLSKKTVRQILKEYIEPLIKKDIDTLILGCTHYPYFKKDINEIFPKIKLIDPGKQIAKNLKKLLESNTELRDKLGKNKKRDFYVSDKPQNFEKICQKFLGKKITKVKKVSID